uniref:C-type lectin domain-containing protein n=1 Tax=Amphiprion percula TaxID=161767 RepID=A0A3P8TN80_AMPPE
MGKRNPCLLVRINCFSVQINLTELSKFLPASSPPRYVYKSWRNLTWEEAQSYCRKFHTDLASIRNEEEWTRVQQAVTGNVFAFVGLYRRTWPSWSDGTEQEFKNCLFFIESVFPFCPEKQQQLWIKLKALKSTMDLNDPAVMEAILKLVSLRPDIFPLTFKFKGT